MLTPYPSQGAHIRRLAAIVGKRGAALDSSHTGTGKTLCALEVAKELGQPVFVVCPKVVIPSWESAIVGQGCDALGVVNYERLRTGSHFAASRSGKSFRYSLPPDALIVFDECHYAKTPGTLNSRLLTDAVGQGYKVLMLSATACASPVGMRAIGYALGLFELRQFYSWAQRMGCRFNIWGALEYSGDEAPLRQLNALLYPGCASKLTRGDMAGHFQDTEVIIEPLDFGDMREIEALVGEMQRELDNLKARVEQDKGEHVLTRILRLRQRAELLKVPVLAGLVRDALDEGYSVPVFLNFRASMDALRERLEGIYVLRIEGGQECSERQWAVERFQENQLRCLLINTAAGGVGVSLHDTSGSHPRMAFVSPTYNEVDHLQVLGRVDRAGALTPTVQRVLVSAGIETRIMKALHAKLANMELVHSGG